MQQVSGSGRQRARGAHVRPSPPSVVLGQYAASLVVGDTWRSGTAWAVCARALAGCQRPPDLCTLPDACSRCTQGARLDLGVAHELGLRVQLDRQRRALGRLRVHQVVHRPADGAVGHYRHRRVNDCFEGVGLGFLQAAAGRSWHVCAGSEAFAQQRAACRDKRCDRRSLKRRVSAGTADFAPRCLSCGRAECACARSCRFPRVKEAGWSARSHNCSQGSAHQ